MDMMGSDMNIFGGNLNDINGMFFADDDDINDAMFMNGGLNVNMLKNDSHVYKPTYKYGKNKNK